MITIAKHFTFDAAHQLPCLPEGHKCKRLHGHTYQVELRFQGQIDARGFVVDYQEIADEWSAVHDKLDHRYLNDIPGLEIPSTERLVEWIFGQMLFFPPGKMITSVAKYLHSVRVSESSTTWAEMSIGDYLATR